MTRKEPNTLSLKTVWRQKINEVWLTVFPGCLRPAVPLLPGGVLLLRRLPGGGASLQRHGQLPHWHLHRAVRGPRLLPVRLPAGVQAAAHHHQDAA